MANSIITIALHDIADSGKRYSLVGMLGWQDVRQKYRRSTLGPFWLTISMGVIIATIGVVFGAIFKTPLKEFLPYLAAGLILWNFISLVLNEGCIGFISAESIIKQLPLPLFIHILRLLWRNLLILGHNILILPIVFLAVGKPITLLAFLSIPGFALVLINLAWVTLILGVLCARYRDLPQIVTSAVQVAFYLTPIMWMPSHLPANLGKYILNFNPVFHLLQIARAPLLGDWPSSLNWEVAIGLAVIGWGLAILLYGRYRRRIAYWL